MSSSEVQRLYDLLLIGLMWLKEDRPNLLERAAASVFASWRNIEVLTGKVGYGIGKNLSFIRHATPYMEFVYGECIKKNLRARVSSSDKHLIVLIPGPQGSLAHVHLFSPKGYKIVITEAGMQYARSILSRYPDLNPTSFHEGWTNVIRGYWSGRNTSNKRRS